MDLIIAGLFMGIAGTLAMDLWALVLNKVAGQALPNWGNVGRWFAYLPRGTLFHNDIAQAAAVRQEVAIGWGAHYAVGIVYGIVWAALAGDAWLAAPSLVPVWIFAVLTLGAGWFLLQPGMGLGWAASKTENPWKVRGFGLLAHTAFGLGMWLAAVLV